MENLKKNSIRILGNIVVCWPQYGDREETLNMSDIASKFNGAYSVNNSTICYVHNNEVFVTPYRRTAMNTIRAAGLVEKHFYVPFSNWDYPKFQKTEWERLHAEAREEHYRDFESDCAKWCSEHAIGELDEDTLKSCFRIPHTGVKVKHMYFENTYYPVCGSETCVDCTVVDNLGRFCTNNGRVVFIYRDGHTYVAKGYGILNKLRCAGYRESGIFVPFSNGEQILDPHLANIWEQLPKQ